VFLGFAAQNVTSVALVGQPVASCHRKFLGAGDNNNDERDGAMVRSKLAAAILSASLALPGVASALGIGEYSLKSYLNQPLELEIDLVQAKDLSSEEILAALATQTDFDRAGVERLFFLTDIRFEIRQRPDGSLAVVARTSKPVTEPFLNFLMEVQWPQGRLLREYTILLDPPVYKAAGSSATATAAPVAQAAAPVPAAPAVTAAAVQPAPPPAYVPPAPAMDSSLPPPPSAARQAGGSTTRAVPAPQPEQTSAATGADEYRVQGSDTMWEIAARHRAGSASVQQTMMAIQRSNPDAFIQGNVNLVKKGYVLRIPSEAEALEVSTSEASSQFANQTRAWRELLDQRQAALPSEGAQLQAGGASRPAAAAGKGTGSGEVTLVAPSASGGTKASGGKEAAALQNQLAIAEEGLDKAARENKELSSRLADLDKQVKGSDKLLAMKNDEISGLQAELNRLRKEKGLAPVEAAKPVEEPAPEPVVAEEVAAPAETEATAAAQDAAKQKAEAPKEKPVKTAKKTEKGGSILLPVVGVLALLAAGGAGFWFWRKKKAAVPQAEAAESDDVHDAQIADDLAQLQDLNLGGDDDSDIAHAGSGGDSESADPLGEADMYMAYGRFQQAADILYAALQREPERGDFRVKLAEVYAEMGDSEAAREQASLAADSGNSGIRSQANALLSRLGGAVAAPAAAAADESLPSLDDLAMEFSGGQEPSGGLDMDLDFETEGSAQPAVAEEDSLDFSLDDVSLPDEPADMQATGSSTAVRPKQDLDDLSLDDTGFGEFSLDEEPVATAASDDLSLDLSDDMSLDSDLSLDDASTATLDEQADELSFESDIDFAADADAGVLDAELPSLDEHETVRTEAITAVQPAANLDLESELADLQSDLSGEGVGSPADSRGGDDFDFLADSDENATKLDLAKAYIDMGDAEGARDILNEVVADGNGEQQAEARKLLEQVG
jgi:pilus assembly protein FimV